MRILPFHDINQIMDNVTNSGYVVGYLNALGCSTVLVEDHYVDQGYMIDYASFHLTSKSRMSTAGS